MDPRDRYPAHNPNQNWIGPGLVVAAVLLVLSGIIWFIGSENPKTPAGYVGYLTKGAVFGKTRFYGVQRGPTSPGRTWLLDVVNVSVTPYNYSEEFTGTEAVLSKDNLKIEFRVHLVWRVRANGVQEFVDKYSVLYETDKPDDVVKNAYGNFLKEPLRTYARDEIQKLDALKIKDEIGQIGHRLDGRVREKTLDTPFEVISIVVGNIQYPAVVADAVAKKLAATQDLERADTEIAIEEKKAKRRVEDARGVAEAMRIINERLTGAYLQHEAIEAQKAMVGSPNHTTIYLPVGPMGVPLVGNLNVGRSSVGTSQK